LQKNQWEIYGRRGNAYTELRNYWKKLTTKISAFSIVRIYSLMFVWLLNQNPIVLAMWTLFMAKLLFI
jgi:hypothetical protein